jgi:hypothetical protein
MPRVVTLSPAQTQISTDKTAIDADGVDVLTVYVSANNTDLTDGEPNPMGGLRGSAFTVTATPSTGVTITQPTGVADANGNVTATLVSTNAATITVGATVLGVTIGNTATVVVGGAPPDPPPEGDPFYETDFDTGALVNENGFVWGGPTRTSVSTEEPRSGTHSLRMAYQAAAAGADSRTQQGFSLGQNLTEVWFEWYYYLPANYTIRSGESPSNNKWFRLWGDDYNAGNKVGASTDFNASFSDNSRLRFEYIFNTYADGLIGFGPSGQQSPATSFGGAMKEAWTRVRMHLKMVTAAQNDGVMELWFDNTKVINFQNVPAKYDDVPYWNQGYILGAANSGFTDQTVIYLDDFKVYESDPEWTF